MNQLYRMFAPKRRDDAASAPRARRLSALLLGAPLLVAAVYWYLGLALLDNSHRHLELARLIRHMDAYGAMDSNAGQPETAPGIATVPGRAPDSDAASDPVRLLLDMRVLLPQLALLEPRGLVALRQQVDALEAQLLSDLRNPDTVAAVMAAFREVHDAMFALAQANLARTRDLQLHLMILLVLFTLAGFALAGLGLRWRARQSERPAWSLAGLEERLFAHTPGAVIVSDLEDRILAVNDAYERMTGYHSHEVVGKPIAFNHSGQQDQRFYDAMRRGLVEFGRWSGEFWLRNKQGEAFADKVTRLRLEDGRGVPVGYLTLSMDMVSSDDAKRLMLWQAHHDTLTKLPNRNLFQERLTRVLLRAHEKGFHGALLSIDLDRFKIVNDSVGPARGDQILTEAAYRIAMCIDESDTVARLGSDHFVVLLGAISDYGDVERLGRSILESIHRPFVLEGRELFITSSIGVALIPGDGDETGELLQKADAARIQVKEQGGNNLAFFEPEMNARAERRLELETSLRRALSENQLLLYYQPVVDVRRGRVASCEALLRWRHPELGMISPADFIPIAEDTGLIVDIGRWVVSECQRQLREWRAQGLEDLRISLNVSPIQLRRAEDVQDLLDLLGAPGEDNGIMVELTESALLENAERVQHFLKEVRSRGSQAALDDFGTGFSSLGYLRNFEFDVLKIDKTFIDELENTRDYGLVASIVSMGRILGMRVVAEGVESIDQVKRLKQIGCDYIQGYHFSKPLPAQEFCRFASDGELRDVG
ncbi:MAG: EAL domain-containing protein [Pseudomonadales bacterium]